MDPRWRMWKVDLLDVLWVLDDAFEPSEVAKLVPTSDMVLACSGYFEVEAFHSDFVVALVVMVNILSVV